MNDLKLHFQRFEFKYLIHQALENTIREHIKPYMVADPYIGKLNASNSYEVFSLYFDSPGFYYYHQKIDGVLKRKKVRLRTYKNNGRFENYAFFEIKRRHDAVVLKDRFLMSAEDYEKLMDSEDFHGTRAIRDQNRKNIIEEFEWERNLRSIGPKILVAYEREPYLGKYNKNFRLTFDRKIRVMENDNLFYAGNDWLDISGDQIVMELKFTGVLPFYVNKIIKEFNLERLSFSKYCNGVEVCGSVNGVSQPAPATITQARKKFGDLSSLSSGVLGV